VSLETTFADGQLAALRCYKLAWPTPTHPTVANSAVLRARETPALPSAATPTPPPTTPQNLAQAFDAQEQGKTRLEPRRKLSTEAICTSCRKAKHYGPCERPRPIPAKQADFNMNLTGSDPSGGDSPSTSPHYQSATSADSALARARDGRPAGDQAASGLADFYRGNGINGMADEPGRMTGGLDKVSSRRPKLADFMRGTGGHSMHEQRGTPLNPYEERLTVKSPPVGWGDEGDQRISRAFGQIDNAADATCVEGGAGAPATGPAVLG